MKKLGLILIVLSVVGIVSPAFAREAKTHDWEVSGMVGGAFPTEDDIDSTLLLEGRLLYNINEHISIGGETGWMAFDADDLGDLNGIPLMANIVLKMPLEATENQLVPYVLGGIGVIFWEFDESSFLSSNGVSVEDEAAFAMKLSGGADYYLTDNIAIFGEGGYIWSDYDTEVRASGLVLASETDTDVFYAVGGVKFGF